MRENKTGIAGLFMKEVGSFRILSHEEILSLALKRDHDSRNKIVEHNIRLVFMVAGNYAKHCNPTNEFLDLVSEGTKGLIRAAKKYDPEKGFKFTTYAVWWINQYIQRSLYTHRHIIRRPEHLLAMEDKISKHLADFFKQNGRYPTEEELMQLTEFTQKEVNDISLLHRQAITSLDNVISNDSKRETSYKDLIRDDACPIDELLAYKEELRNICLGIRQVLSQLKIRSERNKGLFRDRYGFNDSLEIKSLEKVGEKYPISRERVRQILERIWGKIGKDDEWFCQQLDNVRAFEEVVVGSESLRNIFIEVI